MRSIIRSVSCHANDCGERVALRVLQDRAWSSFTYAALQRLVLAWASRFHAMDCPQDSVVFFVLKHRAEMYPAFLGVMRAGLIPSFLPFPTPKQDAQAYWSSHRTLLARVRPRAIVTYGENVVLLEAIVADTDCAILDIDRIDQDGAIEEHTLPPLDVVESGERIALLQHSSGTTGLKKGVALSFDQIRWQIDAYVPTIAAGSDSRIVSWLPVYHDMGLITSFLLPLTLGAEIVSIDAFDWLQRPDMLLGLIGEHRATHCWLPNFAFNHLIRTRDRKRRYDLSSLVALISCSEPAKPDTMQRFASAFAPDGLPPHALQVTYAMAETVFAVTQTALGATPRILSVDLPALVGEKRVVPVPAGQPNAASFVSCGRPVGDVALRIAAEPGRDVGEVLLGGRFLFGGYYRNPQDSEAVLQAGQFRTGDSGFLHEGELFVCGRLKEMLIVHGRNYYATDIEEVASLVPGVKPGRAVAFAVFNPGTASEEAVLLAESELTETSEHAALQKAVRDAVFDRLELSLKTVEILPLGHIVKTTSGKISRKDNLERYLANRQERAVPAA